MTVIGNPQDPKDPWTTAQSGYSKEKVYTRSTDTYGNGETLHIKVSPAVFSAMQEAREKIPQLRTVHDVARDAILHRIHEYNEWIGAGINTQPIDVEVRRSEIDQTLANMAYWSETIEQLDTLLIKLVDGGDFETANYFIELNSEVTSMTAPYIAKLGAVIDKHRTAIINGGTQASFT